MPTDLERKQNPKDPRTLITMLLIVAIVLLSFLFMYNRDYPKININTSSVEALESLPNIGPVLAKRIVLNRPYSDVWELNKVKGIGPATIESIKNKVTTISPKGWRE